MLMGLSVLTPAGGGAVLYYLAAYVCTNLGAFAVVALVRNASGGELVDDCRGLVARSPLAAVALVVFLASLLGLPPLAGFAGKFQVFASVYEATKGAPPWLATLWLVTLGVGALNTVASAYYYLKIARAALLEGAPASTPVRVSPLAGAFLLGLVVALLFAGVVWEPLLAECARAASTFQVK
jgi:NADH-quinone oxidoreductase subunit N